MTTSAETKAKGADAAKPLAQAPAVKGATRRPTIFIVVLLLIAMTGAGYYAFGRIAKLEAGIDGVSATAAQLRDLLASNNEDLVALKASESDAQAKLVEVAQHQDALQTELRELSERGNMAETDWLLAEAEYLILAATQRLALERDASTARAALQAADSRLSGAGEPALLDLREQLARDIAALDGVALPDIEGLALKLAAAITQSEDLPTKPIAGTKSSFTRIDDEQLSADNWRGVLRAIWNDLVNLVEIKDRELPDGVLFDPKLRYLLEQNLKLEFANARLAVLGRDTGNFRESVKLIARQLDQYYDQEDARVAALQSLLAADGTMELEPEIPNIAGSLEAVRAARAKLRAADSATSGLN